MTATTNLGRVSIVPRGAWSNATAYSKLNIVTSIGSSYLAVQDVPAGTALTNTSYWMLIAEKGSTGGMLMLSNEFDSTKSYTVGEYCTNNNSLWRFTSAHSGAWDADDVEEVTVGEELTDRVTTTQFATKAPLESPALTGTPTAPTASASDDSTQIATTAYVHRRGVLNFVLNIGAGTSFSFSNSLIKSTMRVINCIWGTPDNVRTDVTCTIVDGSISFSGTFAGSTTATIDLVEVDSATATSI